MIKLTYVCTYRSGDVVSDLNYDESYALFLEAHKTDNPCVVTFSQEFSEINND